MSKISVIIPTYNEEDAIYDCIKHLKDLGNNLEIIVVDGASSDKTVQIAKEQKIKVLDSVPGRGHQCNKGASEASGLIFLFLHADTYLPADALEQIEDAFSLQQIKIATFKMQFSKKHWLLTVYAYFTRFDSVFTSFGDQCIVMKKSFFHQIGGFPNWPLFEDVNILQKARKLAKIKSLPGPVVTSARRFVEKGIFKQQCNNGFFLFNYLCGVNPDKIAKKYK